MRQPAKPSRNVVPLVAVVAALGGFGWLFRQPAEIILDQRGVIDRQRKELADMAAQAAEVAALRREVGELRAAAGRLSLAALRGLERDALAEAWDRARDGVVLSSAERGGTWLWVNAAFADALGLSRDDVVRRGWRALVDPAAMPTTRTAEGSAWGGPVRGYRVRYRVAGGGWVGTQWWCTAYDPSGHAFCVVWLAPEVAMPPPPGP